MRIKIQILFLFVSTIINAQPKLDYYDFLKITTLYRNGEYQVIANLLVERGYTLKYFNDDYSLGSPSVITKGEMKFIKEEPNYICDYGRPPFAPGTIESEITFETIDYPSDTEYTITFNLIDGSCGNPKDWPPGRHYGSGVLRDKLAIPLIAALKQNKKFIVKVDEFDRGGETYFWDSTSYAHKKISGEVFTSSGNNRIIIKDGGISSLRVWNKFWTYKYPIDIPLEHYYKLNSNESSMTRIPLEKRGNIYYLEVTISGKRIKYILDSGASEVAISESMEKYLNDIGALRKEDYLPSETFRLADGSSTIHKRVLLPSVQIGDITLNRVPAYIAKDSSPLLFGKSALDMLDYWKIDNANSKLEIRRK